MREIKFRAWDKKDEKWWDNYATNNALVLTHDRATGIVFQQYTGLKDKNGVEIYEGDIVNLIHNRPIARKYYSKMEVLFSKTKSGWVCSNENSSALLSCGLFGNGYKLEVIGNIYEDKENV